MWSTICWKQIDFFLDLFVTFLVSIKEEEEIEMFLEIIFNSIPLTPSKH